MSFEIIAVGFYDSEGTWFDINPLNGFPPNSTELACGVSKFVVKVKGNNNNWPYSSEIEINAEQARFLSNLYDTVSDMEYRNVNERKVA